MNDAMNNPGHIFPKLFFRRRRLRTIHSCTPAGHTLCSQSLIKKSLKSFKVNKIGITIKTKGKMIKSVFKQTPPSHAPISCARIFRLILNCPKSGCLCFIFQSDGNNNKAREKKEVQNYESFADNFKNSRDKLRFFPFEHEIFIFCFFFHKYTSNRWKSCIGQADSNINCITKISHFFASFPKKKKSRRWIFHVVKIHIGIAKRHFDILKSLRHKLVPKHIFSRFDYYFVSSDYGLRAEKLPMVNISVVSV